MADQEQRDPISGRLVIQPTPRNRSLFYGQVPKDPAKLADFRQKVLEFGYKSEENADLLWNMCQRDILFFINVFGWLFEPEQGTVPMFNTYPYQDEVFLTMHGEIQAAKSGVTRRCDIGIEKSRKLGGTWMVITLYVYWWLFYPNSEFRLVSKNEEAVDSTDAKDTLFWKATYLVENLPSFLRPSFLHTNLKLINYDNNSSMIGLPATTDVGRGGRCLSLFMDELAAFPPGSDEKAMKSVQHITRCRIFVSTFLGAVGTFHRMLREETDSTLTKIIMDWKDHPERKKGLYTTDDRGKLKILDKDYEWPEDRPYPWVLDGKIRSPYYDEECRAPAATPQSIAEELDRDPVGSGDPFFSVELLKRLHKTTACDPEICGFLDYDAETLEPVFTEDPNGPLKLWIPLGIKDGGLAPANHYAISVGCDVSFGNGGDHTSNSVAIGFNMATGEQVFEFAINTMRADLFADWTMAACKWFNNAFLNWEVNGPGTDFTAQVKDRGYTNVYYRDKESVVLKRKTRSPGWHNRGKSKATTLRTLVRDADTGACVIKSKDVLLECGQFVHRKGTVVHLGAETTTDHSSSGEAHGDRVIAAAVAWISHFDRKPPKAEAIQPGLLGTAYDGTMAWREAQYEADQREEESECVFA